MAELRRMTADEAVDEIEQCAAILASATSPSNAAAQLRRIAEELDELQPEAN